MNRKPHFKKVIDGGMSIWECQLFGIYISDANPSSIFRGWGMTPMDALNNVYIRHSLLI